jgi:hypothetical protein
MFKVHVDVSCVLIKVLTGTAKVALFFVASEFGVFDISVMMQLIHQMEP